MINKEQAKLLLKSFFSVWAVIRATSLPINSIFSIVFMILFYSLYKKYSYHAVSTSGAFSEKHCFHTSQIIGCFFSLCYLLGGSDKILLDLDHPMFCIIILFVTGLGLYFIFSQILFCVYFNLYDVSICYTSKMLPNRYTTLFYPILSFFICLFGWFPYFLSNFPGVMTVDSFNQYAQIIGTYAYSNHHPWIHTLLMKACYHFGLLFTNNSSIAISFYTVFQMAFMAFCVSYFVFLLCRIKVKLPIVWIAILFYALVPYNGMFSVTLWKDIPFAGLFFLFTMILFQFSLPKKEIGNRKDFTVHLVLFIVVGTLMCLFRSNGWYSFLLSVPFILFYFREEIKYMLPANFLIITLVILIKGPLMNAFGVIQPDLVESLSIPIQQVARVFVEESEIATDDIQLLNLIMDTSAVVEEYDAHCSDNIKRLIRKGNPDYLKEHISDYLNLWVRLGIKYPTAYYHAYVDQTYGYWYPDAVYSVVFNEEIAANEFGLESSPAFRGPLFIKGKEIIFKLNKIIPMYGILFGMGTLLWVIIACCGLIITKGRYKLLVLYIPVLALMVTLMLATPLYAELRYAYAMVFSMPLYIVVALKTPYDCKTMVVGKS